MSGSREPPDSEVTQVRDRAWLHRRAHRHRRRDPRREIRARCRQIPKPLQIVRDGRVRFIHEGFHSDGTEGEIRKEIEELLGEKAAPQP